MIRVRERTIPTERLPFVAEVIANFLQTEGVTWSASRIPTAVFSVVYIYIYIYVCVCIIK
jgi:hypothetical protein